MHLCIHNTQVSSLHMNGTIMEKVNEEKYVEVLFVTELKFHKHVSATVMKSNEP